MSDEEIKARTDTWETEGFVFEGNGFLPSCEPQEMADVPHCPMCDDVSFFYALWGKKDEAGEWHGKSFNRCYECGHEWFDEEE